MMTFDPHYLLPIILYAETHYKFKGIYSRLFKKEPEIIADAPFRVEPNTPVPIMLLIKDAHRFPIELLSVTIKLKSTDFPDVQHSNNLNMRIEKQRYWHRIFYLEIPNGMSGAIYIDVNFKIKINNQIRSYYNDNYRISSHLPLQVYVAEEPLPKLKNWYFGDFHYHSNYTEDQVEFGAPLSATIKMAKAIGLHFFAVTDHSYDLDDDEESWATNHPDMPKWIKLQDEVKRLNQRTDDFVIIPGEEVSAGNSLNKNVHLLILNSPHFFEGKGDSAERWFRTKPDFKIGQILDKIEDDAIAIAAHPEMKVPILQKFLIRRGIWSKRDFEYTKLNGYQIWNGVTDETFHFGTQTWCSLLLEGKRLNLISGNDAHGNFNRFRQIGFPFFTFRENHQQIFGNMRTALKLNNKLNLKNIIKSLKNRRVIISNGPVIEMKLTDNFDHQIGVGGISKNNQFQLNIEIKSSAEFGCFQELKIFYGNLLEKKEIVLKKITHFEHPYYQNISGISLSLQHSGYLRAELETRTSGEKIAKCLTNPIWVQNE